MQTRHILALYPSFRLNRYVYGDGKKPTISKMLILWQGLAYKQLIIHRLKLEVTLRMRTGGTTIRRFCSLMHVATVPADPPDRLWPFENTPLGNILG
jgi:hypothetical protein